MSPLGSHWDASLNQLYQPFLATMPRTYTYHELLWCTVERTKGSLDWTPVDRLVDFGNSLGIQTLLKVRTGTCWATGSAGSSPTLGKTASTMPTDMAAYAGFLTTLVTRYAAKGVHEYAIENEVNGPDYWGGTPDQYIDLVKAAATAIHAVDPTAVVLDAGMSSISYGYGMTKARLDTGDVTGAIATWNSYYAQRSGTRGPQLLQVSTRAELDDQLASSQGQRNLAYLQVASALAADQIVGVRQVHFYEDASEADALMDYVRATTRTSTPIEVWEAGIFRKGGGADVATQEQTDAMIRTTCRLLASGATKVLWLPLAAHEIPKAGEEIRGGLLDPSGGTRPAGRIVATLAAASIGATVSSVQGSGYQGVRFTIGTTASLVLWARSGTATVTLSQDARVSDLFADTQRTTRTIVLSPSPVLVSTTRDVADHLSP